MRSARYRATILYRGLTIDFIDGGYFCRLPVDRIQIDADGAPDAYGPASKQHRQGSGTDFLSSAGYPDNRRDKIPDQWRNVLVEDPNHKGYPFERDGYYVSKTSLCDEKLRDPRAPGKYIDANLVSYIVMPQFWIEQLGVRLGDLCLLWHARLKKRAVAIVGDTCPVDEPLGEMSIAAAKQLGGKNVSAKRGAEFPTNGSIYCHIFKNSRPELIWPLTGEHVQSFRRKLERRLERAR